MSPPAQETAELLEEIERGQAKSLYLVHGEEFLARKAADEIVARLLPKPMAGINLVVLDGASPGEVARELATVPMFPGRKVVVVREPEFLAPKRGRGDALSKVREAWLQGKRKEAARRLLALAARAGWGPKELDPASPGAPALSAWKEELDIELSEADGRFLAEVARFCADEGLSAPEGDAQALEAMILKGLPPDAHLVIETSSLDARSSLAKLCLKAGAVVERKVEALHRKLDIGEAVQEALAGTGKRLGRGAQDRLKGLCGGNMRLLRGELEKLALYVGQRKVIELADVDELVLMAREEELNELADAIGARDARRALAFVGGALDQGKHGLQLLGSIAAVIRSLLEDAETVAQAGGASPRMSQREFERELLPALLERAKAVGKKPPHPYVAWLRFQAASRYRVSELLEGLCACADADAQLKLGAGSRLVLDPLLWRLCGAEAAKRSA